MSHLIITVKQVESRVDSARVGDGMPSEISMTQGYAHDSQFVNFTLQDFDELRIGINKVVWSIILKEREKEEHDS